MSGFELGRQRVAGRLYVRTPGMMGDLSVCSQLMIAWEELESKHCEPQGKEARAFVYRSLFI